MPRLRPNDPAPPARATDPARERLRKGACERRTGFPARWPKPTAAELPLFVPLCLCARPLQPYHPRTRTARKGFSKHDRLLCLWIPVRVPLRASGKAVCSRTRRPKEHKGSAASDPEPQRSGDGPAIAGPRDPPIPRTSPGRGDPLIPPCHPSPIPRNENRRLGPPSPATPTAPGRRTDY
jgi:hypothetical protein